MKNLLTAAILVLTLGGLSGCGLQNQINDLKGRTDIVEGDISDLKKRISSLEKQMMSDHDQLVVLGDVLSAQGANLTSQISGINSQLIALAASDSATEDQIQQLQDALDLAIIDASVLEGRIALVEGDNALLNVSVNGLQSDLAATNALIANYASLGTNAYNQIQSQISALQSSSSAVSSNVTILQSSINSALVQIAVLQGYKNITSIKDPCGVQGSYNEVFLKLSDGHYIASFSENANGKNTRFTVLTDGAFQTTDGTNCYFTVSGGGTTISNEHN